MSKGAGMTLRLNITRRAARPWPRFIGISSIVKDRIREAVAATFTPTGRRNTSTTPPYPGHRPWCAMIVRNAFGVAGAAHRNGARANYRYAWPSGRWGSLPLEGGIEAAYRADLDAADDEEAKLAEIEDRLNKLRSPFRSAEAFWIEEIVDPREFWSEAVPWVEDGA